MKKSIITLAAILALSIGVVAIGSAHGWNSTGSESGMMNGGYGMMGGFGMMNGGYGRHDINAADYTKFVEETAPLRKSIAVDRAELNALMAGQNPDAQRVRELTAQIVDNQEQLAKIARTANVGDAGVIPCNGPGYGPRH